MSWINPFQDWLNSMSKLNRLRRTNSPKQASNQLQYACSLSNWLSRRPHASSQPIMLAGHIWLTFFGVDFWLRASLAHFVLFERWSVPQFYQQGPCGHVDLATKCQHRNIDAERTLFCPHLQYYWLLKFWAQLLIRSLRYDMSTIQRPRKLLQSARNLLTIVEKMTVVFEISYVNHSLNLEGNSVLSS